VVSFFSLVLLASSLSVDFCKNPVALAAGFFVFDAEGCGQAQFKPLQLLA
jgi:hypothetical protein